MLKDVVFAEPLDGYQLRLRFEDGVEGVVDVAKLCPFEGVFRAVVFAITDWSEEKRFIGPFEETLAAS